MEFTFAFFEITLFVCVAIGFLAALLGVGGGVLLVPFLVLFMDIPIHYAIGASIIAVIATSSSSSLGYLKSGFTNVRLSMVLEAGAVAGALMGAILSTMLNASLLELLFTIILILAALKMFFSFGGTIEKNDDNFAKKLKLGRWYSDKMGERKGYGIPNTPIGILGSILAGVISTLFGIGAGIVKVPLLNQILNVPLKPSAAVSQFMTGVTAVTGAIVYLRLGYILPEIVAPTALGIAIGSFAGGKIVKTVPSKVIRILFVIMLSYVAVRMAMKGLGVVI